MLFLVFYFIFSDILFSHWQVAALNFEEFNSTAVNSPKNLKKSLNTS